MNEEDTKLYINMLGECSLTYKGNSIDDKTIRSKKFWILLEYLIAFRNKDISQSELIDLIYPEGKSENPANALKTLTHRIRNVLDELNYMDSRDMIIQTRGTYAWNLNMDCVIDVEEFENLCNKGNSPWVSDDEKLECYLRAIDLYKGDFLHKSALEPWAVEFNVYYHTLYGNIVHKCIELLKERNKHEQIIEICQKALAIDAFDEVLYYHLILGLIDTKKPQLALKEYQKMSTMFYKEFGVTPSKELRKLYRDIIKSNKKVETDLSVIKETLNEKSEITGAFYCEYEIFKDFYQLEVRAAGRTGETVYLGLLTLTNTDGEMPSLKMLNGHIDKIQACIQKTLRKGDVFAKYSVSQFIMMLPLTTFEDGEMAIKRIIKKFHKQNPHSPLTIIYSLQSLEMVIQ